MINATLGHILGRLRDTATWDSDPRPLTTADSSMEATRRELAVFASTMVGAQSYVGQFGRNRTIGNPLAERRLFRDFIEQTALPYMVIDPRPGLHIVDINDPYAAATLADRRTVAGGRLFDIFPDNPDDPGADGVSNLYESIQRAAQSGEPHAMALQRYDVCAPDGQFVQRYWRPVNTPIFDDDGTLLYVLHYAGELPPDFSPDARAVIGRLPTSGA